MEKKYTGSKTNDICLNLINLDSDKFYSTKNQGSMDIDVCPGIVLQYCLVKNRISFIDGKLMVAANVSN